MGKLIDGKKIADNIVKKLAKKTAKLNKKPKLTVVLVGRDKPSIKYVEKKKILAEKIGILFELKKFNIKITTKELKNKIIDIERDKTITGLIIQLPLPKHIKTQTILDAVNPRLDVDCLNSKNQKKLSDGKPVFIPPTAAAILEILKYLKINLINKKIAVIGKGILVGKPIAAMLKKKGSKVIICDSKTANTKDICLKSDIIITGVGKKHIITKDMVNKNTVVIDGGTVFEGKKIYGDVDFKNVSKIAKFTTPTPGGVGPLTVVYLLKNTVENK